MSHTIRISDDVYEDLKSIIDDEHIENGNMSDEIGPDGRPAGYRPSFSEVISHLLEDREELMK